MATLYKHGVILHIDKLTHRLAMCADGQVLRNDGDGFKCWKKIKAGLDPHVIAHKWADNYKLKMQQNPAFAEWHKLVHDNFPLKLRGLAVEIVSLMPDDPDGCWSEINDYSSIQGDGDLVSIEDCCALCRAYKAATAEAKAREAARSQAHAKPVTV